MKFIIVPVIAVLGACTTYGAETAAVSETEALVVADAPADAGEADAAGAAESSGETKTAVDRNRIICKRTTVTGSRFATKTCKKWSDWEAMADQAKTVTEGARRRGTQGNIQQGG